MCIIARFGKKSKRKGVVFSQHPHPLGVDKVGKTCYTKGLGPRIEYVLAYLFNMNHGASPYRSLDIVRMIVGC
jgi:hypothetical protein